MVDVTGCEDKDVGSETEECIVNDERRAALKIDEISHCHRDYHHHNLGNVLTQLRGLTLTDQRPSKTPAVT
jgi:hypothetical protein